MTYSFIGAGNMARCMIKGFIENKALSAGEIFAYDIDAARLSEIAETFGINTCADASAAASAADVLVLAVKPNQLEDALRPLLPALQRRKPVIISLPVGISLARIEALLDFELPVVRIVPNVSAEVFASVTAFCANASVTPDDKSKIIQTLPCFKADKLLNLYGLAHHNLCF